MMIPKITLSSAGMLWMNSACAAATDLKKSKETRAPVAVLWLEQSHFSVFRILQQKTLVSSSVAAIHDAEQARCRDDIMAQSTMVKNEES